MKEIARRIGFNPIVGQRRPVVDGSFRREPIEAVDKSVVTGRKFEHDETFELMYVDNSVAVIKDVQFSSRSYSRIAINTSDNPKRTKIERAATRYRNFNRLWTLIICSLVAGVVFLSFVLNPLSLIWTIPLAFLLAIGSGFALERFATPRIEIENSVHNTFDNAHTAKILSEALSKHPHPEKVTSLIRHKYLLLNSDVASIPFLSWVKVVAKIIAIDPEYEPELIPLVESDAVEILKKMIEISEKEALIVSRNEKLDVRAALFARSDTEKWMKKNSKDVKAIAMARLEALDRVIP